VNSISNDLQQLIAEGLMKTPLPIKKGNSIIIVHIVIRYNKNTGYHIFNTKDSQKICTTQNKHAAIGVAKSISKGKDISKILAYDQKLTKYNTDLFFYNHTIKNSKDINKVDICEHRASSTEADVDYVKTKLEKIIFED